MSFIQKLCILMIALVLSPVLIAAAYYFRCEKRWFLKTLFSPLADEIKAPHLAELVKTKDNALEEKLTDAFSQLSDEGYWLNFRIDWCDSDEVVPQANAIAEAYGIKDVFSIDTDIEEPSVWQLLVFFDIWLQQYEFEVVLWDQGSDEYCGFICPSTILRRFIRAGKLCDQQLVKLDHENE